MLNSSKSLESDQKTLSVSLSRYVFARASGERSEPVRVGGGLVPVVGGGSNRERVRHSSFYCARDAISVPKLDYRFSWGSLGLVYSYSCSYRHHVKDRGIVLINKNTKELKVLPYFTRFSDGYYRKAIRKIKRIHSDRGVFLTLTVDPRRYLCLKDAYRALQGGWNRLLTMLRKRFKTLEFVRIPEFQSNGSPHLHVLFFGISRLIDADELREFWDRRYGVGTFVYLKKLYNGSNRVVSYLVKYMVKLLDAADYEFKGSDGLVDAQAGFQLALAWSLDLRAFSVSQGILDKGHRTSQTGNWIFLGSFALVDVWSWDGCFLWEVMNDLVALKPPDSEWNEEFWSKIPQ